MTRRDADRAAVYAAELAAFAGTDLESVIPLGAVVARAGAVLAPGGWWPGPVVEVRAARRDASSSSTRCRPGGAVVRIAAEQSTVATLAHELAHALAGDHHGHDAIFRRAYLDVVQAVTNAATADRRHGLHVGQLADAFTAAGLAVGPRQWPAPTAGRPIAL